MSEEKKYGKDEKPKGFRSLIVYQKSLSQTIFINTLVEQFPKHELYSMSDQVRRSSRSVCANIGEAYRKRQYPNHFKSKLSDADMENTETQVWFDIALGCELIDQEQYNSLLQNSEEIGRLLSYMIEHSHKFCPAENTKNQSHEPFEEYFIREISFDVNEVT